MNSMTRIISRALAVSLLVLVAACSDSSDGILYKDDLPTAAAPEAPAPAPGPGNIVEVATEAGDFPTLLAAVEAAGLVDALSDDSASLTVFAPTEAAFAALPEGALDSLLADPDALAGVLTYHVLGSAVTVNQAADLAGSTVETLNGGKVAITVRDDDYVYINLAQVVSYDIEASNGIIHVIDAVLLPPDLTPSEMTIAEIASSNEDFETLVAAATAANLVGTLNDPEASLTVFAPTDAAFEALGESTLNYLLNNLDDLESTLLYHVVAGAGLSSIDAIAATGSSIEMANGDEAMISLGDSGLMINMSNIVTTDIVASNGIIHVIDTVLDAPSVEAAPLAVTLAANGGFSTLSGLIEDAGLTETLMDPNANVTVFAPTDDAFAQMKRLGVFTKLSGSVTADFTTGAFDGSGAIADAETETYTFPTGAQDWAGFANNADIYPLSFPEGGSITFTASAATPTNVRFRFEANPYPNTEPSYNTENVLVDSAEAKEYTIEIPSQGDQTFNSFLMYVVERDQPVMVTNVVVNAGPAEEPVDEDLVNLLTYHVYGDTVLAADAVALAGNSIEMLNGEMAALSVDGDGNLLINDARVTTADIVTGNGVIHAINKVLSLPGAATSVVADFTTGAFDGSGAIADAETETYTFPTGAQDWAGFANNADIYPLSFPEGGSITFTASAATPTNVRFRFEANPYPNTEPSYNTENVLVDSAEAKEYTIEIPSQGDQTFNSFLMYVVERDQPVMVTNVVVTSGTAEEPEPESDGSIVFSGVFGGSVVDLETNTYTVPAGSEGWAGFANEDTSVYPFTFAEGGHITFTASAATPTTVRFRFEKAPYPDTEPSFETATVLIDSDTPKAYSVEFASQGDNTFTSFLMYISEQDSPVVMTDVSVNQGPIPIVFSGVFGGSVVDLETNTYTVPAGSEAWAGFANEDTSLYPFTFTDGGHITFTASAAAPTTVRFRFEKNPYPDTEPSFETATVLIDSDTPQQYSVQFGSQGENTFSSFLMYISEQDSPVVMTDVSVNQGPIPIVFSGVFGGSVVDLETSTYTVPAGSEGWAGFANEDTSVYPFEFANGGSITFTASAAATTTVRFRFEKNPYPDTEPSFDTSTVTIDSDTATEYTVEFGAQGANTFSSFLFYITEQDSPVVMTDVVVRAN